MTTGPLIEEGLNPVHYLLVVLGGGDVEVHVPVPHVTIPNHSGSTLAFQSFLANQEVILEYNSDFNQVRTDEQPTLITVTES